MPRSGRQIDQIRRGVDIVVATPGRLIDLMERKAVTLADIDITVLDEADHMADLGFLPAVTRILDATPAGRQRMLFSATLDRGVAQLVHTYLSDPAVHAVAPEVLDGGVAEHRMLVMSAGDKVPVAAEIAGRPARTLFFVRTKHGADRLAKQFRREGVDAVAIHGNLNQNQRQRALAAFAAGQPRVLVATDVAARGIHVDDVELVVHFDPPNDHKDYLHRSGRTARAGASGMVVALVDHAQARDVSRMHDAAGVTATRDDVQAGHHAVRQIATSGTPFVPTAVPPPARPAQGGSRPNPRGAGPSRLGPVGRGSRQRELVRRKSFRRQPPSAPGRSAPAGQQAFLAVSFSAVLDAGSRGLAPGSGVVVPQPEQLQGDAVVPVRLAQVRHAQPPADGDGLSVVRVYDGQHLGQAARAEGQAGDAAARLGRVAAAPVIRVEMPADLDLAVVAGQRNQQHRADHRAGIAQLQRPEPVGRMLRVAGDRGGQAGPHRLD